MSAETRDGALRETKGSGSLVHLGATVLACVFWGGSIVGTKLSFDALPPFALGLVRFALATLVFFALLALRRQLSVPSFRDLRLMALTGLLGTTLYFAAENLGTLMLSATTSALVVGSFPAMTVVLECLHDRRLPSARMAGGVTLAFAGVAVLSLSEVGGSAGDNALGILVLMTGGVFWAFYNLLMRGFDEHVSTLVITSWQTLFGALGFIPLALIEGATWEMPSGPSAWSLAYLVLGCTVAAFTLYNFGLKKLPASVASAFVNLIPVVGLVASALILGEPISLGQIVGCAAIVVGIFLSSR